MFFIQFLTNNNNDLHITLAFYLLPTLAILYGLLYIDTLVHESICKNKNKPNQNKNRNSNLLTLVLIKSESQFFYYILKPDNS